VDLSLLKIKNTRNTVLGFYSFFLFCSISQSWSRCYDWPITVNGGTFYLSWHSQDLPHGAWSGLRTFRVLAAPDKNVPFLQSTNILFECFFACVFVTLCVCGRERDSVFCICRLATNNVRPFAYNTYSRYSNQIRCFSFQQPNGLVRLEYAVRMWKSE